MYSVRGRIVSNCGVASETLRLQMPLFPRLIQEALGHNLHLGTLNVQTEVPVLIPIGSYDLDTKERIRWSEKWVPERFLFKRCKLVVNGETYDAWFYKPSSTPNSIHPHLVEILTEHIENIPLDGEVELVFENVKMIIVPLVL